MNNYYILWLSELLFIGSLAQVLFKWLFVRFYVDLRGFKSAYFALSVDLIPQFYIFV